MARMTVNVITISFLLFLTTTVKAESRKAQPGNGVYDITQYGASAGSEIIQALTNAWKDACATEKPSKIVIPKGTYKLSQALLEGPCKGPITVQLQGTVEAPGTIGKLKGTGWVTFQHVERLTLTGGGTFDGQGKVAWGRTNCAKNDYCKNLPINIGFNFVSNSLIQGITSLNSKQFHVNVLGCKNITFQHFTIIAPGDSPNTDGIHIGRSDGVNIIESDIKTGDDCISIGDGTKNMQITKVKCGPGHGISVGSLGRYPKEDPVEGIIVKDCTLTNTMFGVRIKTWPASPPGIATGMHFDGITMTNVSTPILIDQVYCPWNQCKAQIPSKVKISDVSFRNIKGTSATLETIKVSCSKGIPCEKVELSNIDLRYDGKDGPGKCFLSNVKPKISGYMNPKACTEPIASH